MQSFAGLAGTSSTSLVVGWSGDETILKHTCYESCTGNWHVSPTTLVVSVIAIIRHLERRDPHFLLDQQQGCQGSSSCVPVLPGQDGAAADGDAFAKRRRAQDRGHLTFRRPSVTAPNVNTCCLTSGRQDEWVSHTEWDSHTTKTFVARSSRSPRISSPLLWARACRFALAREVSAARWSVLIMVRSAVASQIVGASLMLTLEPIRRSEIQGKGRRQHIGR